MDSDEVRRTSAHHSDGSDTTSTMHGAEGTDRDEALRHLPPAATAGIAAGRSAVAAAMIDQLVAEQKIVVKLPDDTEVARWRKVVDFAKRHRMVPEGCRIEKRMTWQKDLEISLLPGLHFNAVPENGRALAPAQIPESLDDLHPVIAVLKKASDCVRVCSECLPRALKILQAIAEATEKLGYAIESGDTAEAAMALCVHQSRFEVTIEEAYEDAPAVEQPKYDWQRITKLERVPTGKLELLLLPRSSNYHTGRRSWGDRKRWSLEDKVPEALNEIIGRGVAVEKARVAKERAAAERTQRWEAAMEQARRDFVEDYRASILRRQVKGWREAQETSSFCDAVELHLASSSDAEYAEAAMAWVSWARDYAASIDPIGQDMHIPDAPNPKPEELKPFLRGWSPYGPSNC